MTRSRLTYALATIAVFAVEVLIALFVHDGVIRPYVGDILAVILVYLGLRAVTPWPVATALIVTLLIAAAIEFGQYFHLLDVLGLERSRLARVVLGGAFDLTDFACYFGGAALVMVGETVRKAR